MLSRFPCAPSPKNFRITFYKKERVLQLLTWLQNMRSINVSCVVLRCINRQRIKTSDQFSFLYQHTSIHTISLEQKRPIISSIFRLITRFIRRMRDVMVHKYNKNDFHVIFIWRGWFNLYYYHNLWFSRKVLSFLCKKHFVQLPFQSPSRPLTTI